MAENLNEALDKMIGGALLSFSLEDIRREILKAIEIGAPIEKIIEVLTKEMGEVGRRYEAGEYFVTDLIIASEMMKEATATLKPYMKGDYSGELGTVVLASVAGDIHDIGKNILATLLTAAGFKVVDLGVDVQADSIVETMKASGAKVLGLSALLTTNLEQIPIVVEKLRTEGLRDHIKVIVGGATVTEEFAEKAGVDGYAKTAVAGVEMCKTWIKES